MRSSGSVGTNNGRVSRSSGNNGHDSGFDVEEDESEPTRPISQASFERWSSFSSDVDPSLETSMNESGLEDSVEREYFSEMKKMHRGESLVSHGFVMYVL